MYTVKNHFKQISDISQSFASFYIFNTVFAQEFLDSIHILSNTSSGMEVYTAYIVDSVYTVYAANVEVCSGSLKYQSQLMSLIKRDIFVL